MENCAHEQGSAEYSVPGPIFCSCSSFQEKNFSSTLGRGRGRDGIVPHWHKYSKSILDINNLGCIILHEIILKAFQKYYRRKEEADGCNGKD